MRRLQKLGANESDLLEVYAKLVRSIAEIAFPVWNSGIKEEDIVILERIQKLYVASSWVADISLILMLKGRKTVSNLT